MKEELIIRGGESIKFNQIQLKLVINWKEQL